MNCSNYIFSAHSLKSILSRDIAVEEVIEVINKGETIAEYENDKPYPSSLLLKFVNGRHIHIVVAQNLDNKECIVITCYIPDPLLWDKDFKRKIK